MFVGKLGQECPTGYIYDAGIQDCVKTWSTDVTDCADPSKTWNELTQQCEYSGTGGTSSNIMLYLGLGLAALLLLSFAGGRASKKTSSGSRLVSRTTTRSLFA
jgi:hypothetical protein